MRITVTTFGCAEYLRHHGYTSQGVVEFRRQYPKISSIQKAVAKQFEIPLAEMKTARRTREVARPRQVAMYLSRELTPKSLPVIGRHFGGRDHTTVLWAIRQIEKLLFVDTELDNDVRSIKQMLEAV